MTHTYPPSKSLAVWLFICCTMIAAILVVGAITRLTESGLSMVEWRAMLDMLPPLTQQAWLDEFHKYKLTPEFKLKNSGMDVDAFKNIYFWEWLHRLLGRVVGLVYALPLVYFWVRGKIPAQLKPRFVAFLLIGGLQGFFGWYMVKSGLINEPRVSHYRLTLHLCTAILLFTLLWIQALGLWACSREWMAQYATQYHKKLVPHAWIALAVVCVTIVWGAFVAGLDAGMIYNEFPLMGGKLIPGEFMFLKPWWANFLHNHATVQWTHRVLGTVSFLAVFSFGLRCAWSRNWFLTRIGYVLCGVICAQFILGITTLLTQVNVHVAATHQFGALLTLTAVITALVFLRANRSE